MSPRLRSLYKAAEEKECLAQMEKCFRKAYVEQVLQGNAKKAAGEVLELLQLSVHTHDKLQAMEQKMCVADFAKRLCAGHWEITGTESGETPALWMRIGLATSAFGSRRSLRPGTQEWYAAIRAYVYMYELFIRSRHLRSEVPAVKVICLDMRGQGFLDAVRTFCSSNGCTRHRLSFVVLTVSFPSGPFVVLESQIRENRNKTNYQSFPSNRRFVYFVFVTSLFAGLCVQHLTSALRAFHINYDYL